MKLKFSFKYTPDLVPEHERRPQLHFYLTSDLGHELVVLRHNTGNVVEFELPEKIEYDSALWVWAFVNTKNSNDEPSCNEAGSNFFYLRDLLSNRSEIEDSRELVVWNARRPDKGIDAKKGDITLYVHKTSFASGRSPVQARTPYSLCAENHDSMIRTLVEYLGRVNAIFQSKPSTYDSVKYLHLPVWQFGTIQVPGNAFAMVRAQHSPESWWVNASRMALRRHYRFLSLEEAEARFLSADTSEDEVMAVISKMHTGVVNQVATYLSDAVYVNRKGTSGLFSRLFGEESSAPETYNAGEGTFAEDLRSPINPHSLDAARNQHYSMVASKVGAAMLVSMEAFTLGRLRVAGEPENGVDNSGDCEDLAGEAGLQAMELKERTDWSDAILQKMHAVRQNYVFLQMLMGVRGRQLSDAQKAQITDSVHAKLGGHMAGTYMSKEALLQMIGRYNKAPQPFEGLQAEVGAVRADLMMLEGTGLIDPQCSPEYAQSITAMRYLIRESGGAFRHIKFISPESESEVNSFYRVVQSFCVVDFADSYATQEFVVLKRRGSQLSTGADYLEFRNNDPSVSLYAQPEMKEAEIRYTKQLLKNRFPVAAYKEPAASVYKPVANPHLERVKAVSRTQQRTQPRNYEVVDLFPRYSQVSEDLAAKFIDVLHAKSKVFKFDYFEENLGPSVGGYMVRFYIAK